MAHWREGSALMVDRSWYARGWLPRYFLAAMVIGGAAIAASTTMPSTTQQADLMTFPAFSPTGGKAFVTRTPTMALTTVEAAGLEPSDAYTLWWVVFNAHEECSDNACGEDDVFVDGDPANGLNIGGIRAAQIAIGYASGNIAKEDGTLEFGGRLMKDVTSGHQVLFSVQDDEFVPGDGPLLTANGENVEIHLVVQSHGQARGGDQLLKQLSMNQTGCTPRCEDVQAAIFVPLP